MKAQMQQLGGPLTWVAIQTLFCFDYGTQKHHFF